MMYRFQVQTAHKMVVFLMFHRHISCVPRQGAALKPREIHLQAAVGQIRHHLQDRHHLR
jgi:hypothetical protein